MIKNINRLFILLFSVVLIHRWDGCTRWVQCPGVVDELKLCIVTTCDNPPDRTLPDTEEENDLPDCGKSPYQWNDIGQHYERRFSQWCELYTGDENETLYHDLWISDTPLGGS